MGDYNNWVWGNPNHQAEEEEEEEEMPAQPQPPAQQQPPVQQVPVEEEDDEEEDDEEEDDDEDEEEEETDFNGYCNLCDKTFKKFRSVKSHQKKHNEAKVVCPNPSCGRRFRNAAERAKHCVRRQH